jgi:beta-mannosidase
MRIWKSASLVDVSHYINFVLINQHFPALPSLEVVDLNLTIGISSLSKSEGLSLQISIDNSSLSPIIKEISAKELSIQVRIQDPILWYPRGYGDQHLYQLDVKLGVGNKFIDSVSKSIGIRHVSLIENTDEDGKGSSFYFVINSVPVFVKGSNMIPDNVFHHSSQENLELLIHSAVASHQNMIRVWGGGVYPSEYFYELCDQHGLMIWQELMFACAMYPRDSDFLQNVQEEVRENLRRISHHASIVIIGGNNENEIAFSWFDQVETNPALYHVDYAKLYLDTIYPIVQEICPDRAWVHSSPSN